MRVVGCFSSCNIFLSLRFPSSFSSESKDKNTNCQKEKGFFLWCESLSLPSPSFDSHFLLRPTSFYVLVSVLPNIRNGCHGYKVTHMHLAVSASLHIILH